MKTIMIEIEGKKYPLRATMGAMKEFKKQTGKDPKDMDAESAVEMATFIYCCVVSACRKDGVEMTMTLDDFLDSVDVDTVNAWGTSLSAAQSSADSSKAKGKAEGKAKA